MDALKLFTVPNILTVSLVCFHFSKRYTEMGVCSTRTIPGEESRNNNSSLGGHYGRAETFHST